MTRAESRLALDQKPLALLFRRRQASRCEMSNKIPISSTD